MTIVINRSGQVLNLFQTRCFLRKELTMNYHNMLGRVVEMIMTVPSEWLGTLCDLFGKLTGGERENWFDNLKLFLRKEPCWTARVVASILRLISGNESIIIRATSGEKTIASATDIFFWGIDPDFTNWGLDVLGQATLDTPVQVYEMTEDGNFKTIFGSLGRDLNKLCLTQEQIIAFVQDYKNWLRTEGDATFFLFKVGNEFFVARVHLSTGDKPHVNVRRFSSAYVWNTTAWDTTFLPLRVVLPQTLES